MGCGESKHAVATGNTSTPEKSSKDMFKNGDDERSEKGNKKTGSLVQQREQESQNASKCLKDHDNVDCAAGAEVKDVTVDEELEGEGKETKKEDGVAVEDQEPAGRLISKDSPNHFFSWRKDDDIEGIVSEGKSEKSEYSSPHIGFGKQSFFSDGVKLDDVAEKTFVQETGQTNRAKEANAGARIEPKVQSPDVETKQIIAREEKLEVSPIKDLKAT